jgi:EAL domain-containing protein (putative c-di-GMP-specific phosphodiesterase class I)/CheY-like chemotaxis protein
MYPKNAHILLIDSDPASQQDLTDPLIKNEYHVSHARSAREGMEKIYQSPPDMILLARKLPDMDGLLFCAELKNDLVLRHIPLILIDYEPLLESELAARESGADDYLHKPISIRELDGRIQQILRQGTMGFNCHPVTGLPGYDAVYHKVQETLEKGRPFAICFLDIHAFRHFNQRYGYTRGDELLRKISRGVVEVLQTGNRYLDFFGHLGADDFVLVTDPNRAEGLCSKILEYFELTVPNFYEPSDLEKGYILTRSRKGRETSHKRIFLSIAIITHEAGRPGHVARIVEQGSELLALAKKEQKSLWVKERRRSLASLPSVTQEADRPGPEGVRSKPVSRSRPAAQGLSEHFKRFREIVQAQSLQIHFQPIVHIDTGYAFGYEALVRGPPETYFESPVILFSLARKLDMELVLDLICLRKLQKVAGRIPDSKKIFFNVSPSSFSNPMFREFCERAARDLLPGRVVLEVTRKRRIREYTRFREAAAYFKTRGYNLAVDDARAGTLSLRTILELEPDYIKTDITVTRDIHNDATKQRIFRQFRAFCNRQQIEIIPEGVETEQEKDYLRRNGARLGQGFLFSPPAPLPA